LLTRSGRSRAAVAAHLAARGVDGALARSVLPEGPEAELAAAVAFARRRRIGPFRSDGAVADLRRELGMLARAGFAQSVAGAALRLAPDAAEDVLVRLKQS
jgi:regulatory protein